MHLHFRTLDTGCVCIDATDDNGKPLDEYFGRLFADVMDEFGIFVDEQMTYFVARSETHNFKCRFWGNNINLYVTPVKL